MNLKVVKNLSFALFFLYFFLVSIKLLEKGIKTLGAEYTDQLFESVSNPFAGLLVGILCTVLVQSSSVTTSTIVGLVGSGVLSLEYAIPMVMGANIGTTVTNTLVSFGHVRREQEFKRAFAASTMHDFFNVIVVIILFPLDLITDQMLIQKFKQSLMKVKLPLRKLKKICLQKPKKKQKQS